MNNVPTTIIRSQGDLKVDAAISRFVSEFDHKILGTPVEDDNYVTLLSGGDKMVNFSLFIKGQYVPAQRITSGRNHPGLCHGSVMIDGQWYEFHITWSSKLARTVFVSYCSIDGNTLIVCTDFKLWVDYHPIDTADIDNKICQGLVDGYDDAGAEIVSHLHDTQEQSELTFPGRFGFPDLSGLTSQLGRSDVSFEGRVESNGGGGAIIDGGCDYQVGAVAVLVESAGVDDIHHDWMILVWDRDANKPALIGFTGEVIYLLHEFKIVINGRVFDPYLLFSDHQTATASASQSSLGVSDCFESDGLPSPRNLPEDPHDLFEDSETDPGSEFYSGLPGASVRHPRGFFNSFEPSTLNVERRDLLNGLNTLLADKMKEVVIRNDEEQVVIRNGDDPVGWGVVAFCGPIPGIRVTWLTNPDAEPVFVALKVSTNPLTMTSSATNAIAPSARYGTVCLSDYEGYSNLVFRFVDSEVDNVRKYLNYEIAYGVARFCGYPLEELAKRSDTHRTRFEWQINEGRHSEEWEAWSDHIPYTSDSEYF